MKKDTCVFLYIKHSKFWSVSLEHFVERKPLILKSVRREFCMKPIVQKYTAPNTYFIRSSEEQLILPTWVAKSPCAFLWPTAVYHNIPPYTTLIYVHLIYDCIYVCENINNAIIYILLSSLHFRNQKYLSNKVLKK